MIDIAKLKTQLEQHEALRLKPYKDSVGKWTIGIGRNLDDVGISRAEALFMLDNDVDNVLTELDKALPWWRTLSDVRQLVVANMCFNLGMTRFLKFKKFLAAAQAGEFDLAAAEMLNSTWATQVGIRATTLAGMMSTNLV